MLYCHIKNVFLSEDVPLEITSDWRTKFASFLLGIFPHIHFDKSMHLIGGDNSMAQYGQTIRLMTVGNEWNQIPMVISFQPEWNAPIHSNQNEMIHSIPVGMDKFTLTGMKWLIPCWSEWNGPLHSSQNGIEHFTQGQSGMAHSIPDRMKWTISFWTYLVIRSPINFLSF